MIRKADLIEAQQREIQQLREEFATQARHAAQTLNEAADRAEQDRPSDPNSLGVLQGQVSQIDSLAGQIKQAKGALVSIQALED